MRKLISLLMIIFLGSIAGCDVLPTSTSSSKHSYYLAYMSEHDKESFFITYVGYQGELDEVSRDYYLINHQNNNLEKVLSSFNRNIYFNFHAYEQLDINDFVALNRVQTDSANLEIGRFSNSKQLYVPLVENDSVFLLYDSVEHNRIIFCYNDDSDDSTDNEIFIMDREGSIINTIPLGINVTISRYGKLDHNFSYLRGYSDEYRGGIVFFLDHDREKVASLMKKDSFVKFHGTIEQFALIQRGDDLKSSISSTFYLHNYDGSRKKELFNIDNALWSQSIKVFIDNETSNIFILYATNDHRLSIAKYNLFDQSLKEIFSCNIDKDITHIRKMAFNEKEKFFSFIVQKDGNDKWYIFDIGNEEENLTLPPKNSNVFLSDDGKILLCLGYHRNAYNNGVINYQHKEIIPFNKKFNVFERGVFYLPPTQEFYFTDRNNRQMRIYYSVNPNGSVQKVVFED